MNFVDAGDFVLLCSLRERANEAAQVLPAGVTQDDGSLWVVVLSESFEERIEVVG